MPNKETKKEVYDSGLDCEMKKDRNFQNDNVERMSIINSSLSVPISYLLKPSFANFYTEETFGFFLKKINGYYTNREILTKKNWVIYGLKYLPIEICKHKSMNSTVENGHQFEWVHDTSKWQINIMCLRTRQPKEDTRSLK